MPSSVPIYPPYYGSVMPNLSQRPPISSASMGNDVVPNIGTTEFPEFSTQIGLGVTSAVNEGTRKENEEDSTHARRKSPKWTTDQNLVLISGWIKYGTDSVVGRNQKSEAYWGKIAENCNEHCSFNPPRDGASCRNHYNYMSKTLSQWVGAYDNATRMQQSGWSENDVLPKAHEIYSGGKNEHFNLMSEWHALRDQPRYGSQVGGNSGSSSGSKRSRENDASDSNSVGSSVRPMGRDATKKKSEIEERYIVNRFRERRKKFVEEQTPRSKRKYFKRDHVAANQRLIDDYFANQPTYDDAIFRRRFRMRKHVFLRIVGDLSSNDNYFTQRVDAANKEGISPLAKCTTAMRMLAYGVATDAVDEYIKIGGNTPRVKFFLNQRPYDMAYYLPDGIYPSYPTFVKSIRLPQSEPDKLFAKYQEGCRKYIERAFGVLQARFKIIREPARMWDIGDLAIIMRSCIILHNMIVEDERDTYAQHWTDFGPIMINRQVVLVHHNHFRLRCYPFLQIMCVLDLNYVIQRYITNCKQI
uniref:Myb-like domain-containing protein n=1 Tax=Brassica oleracea var. oleracea TaxID=109376 RepID=A0A0D3A5K6_BRAOL